MMIGRVPSADVSHPRSALRLACPAWPLASVAQYPVLLPGTAVTLSNAGAPNDTLVAIVVLVIVAVLLIGPAFILLYSLQSRRLLGADEAATLPAAGPADPPEPRASHDDRKPQTS